MQIDHFFLFLKYFFGGGGNRTRVRRHSTRGLYMLISFLNLVLKRLKGKGPPEPALMIFASQAQGKPEWLSCSTTLLKHRRQALEKRHAYLLGSNRQCFCT